MRHLRSALTVALATLLMAFPALGAAAQDATPATDNSEIEIAYVLHGINAFTERIQTGAEDAARDYGVTLEVFGDASFDAPTHIAFFETALQRGFDGIALVTFPGGRELLALLAVVGFAFQLVLWLLLQRFGGRS